MRKTYWSCTKFADWVRGTPTLSAGTSTEWSDWRKQAKTKHPLRYWLAEEALDELQKIIYFIPDKLYEIKYYINNRYVSRTHSLTANPSHIRPGTWCDLGDRILPCLFDELVNFVEVEQAWKNIAWDNEARKKYWAPFYATGWFRWRTWRSAEAGLEHLKWQQSLVLDESMGVSPDDENYGKENYQAIRAKEVETLYRWYLEVYLKRPDPMDVSGWSQYCDEQREKYNGDIFIGLDNKSPEDQDQSRAILDKMTSIEQKYRDEDTEMLIRLIKLREFLWT